MKFNLEIPSDMSDKLVIQALRAEADIVWHAMNYFRKEENPKEYEIVDFWNNYQLLGALCLVEEYLTDNPEIRRMYPRDEEWMAWDE